MSADVAWDDWKSQLEQGKVVRDEKLLSALWRWTGEAEMLVRQDSRARSALRETLDGALTRFLSIGEGSFWQLMLYVLGAERFEKILVSERTAYISSVEARAYTVRTLTAALCAFQGRQWVRVRAQRWWQSASLSEEESDAFFEALLNHQVFGISAIESWGSEAANSARRVALQASVKGNAPLLSNYAELPIQVGSASTAPTLRDRTAALAQPVAVALDIRDSGFGPHELSRARAETLRHDVTSLLARALSHHSFARDHWMRTNLSLLLENAGRVYGSGGEEYKVRIPLLRLLHMRLLLESPSLTDALSAPEQFLVPEIIEYVAGRDYVAYAPELRVFNAGERRWRARWIETTAEALSALVLEDVLNFDLTTLSRIPEATEATADFMGRTMAGEPIVFETKGSTSWKTHVAQRARALTQLGKGVAESEQVQLPAWSNCSGSAEM